MGIDMVRASDTENSILIVSRSEKFDLFVRKILPGLRFHRIDHRKSASAARTCLLEQSYDLVVINAPLPDETAHEFALDICEQYDSSLIIAVPSDLYDDTADYTASSGIMILPKPLQAVQIKRAVEFMAAIRQRFHRYDQKILRLEGKVREIQSVSQAKLLLIEHRHISESEAHRFIGKAAMDRGVSRRVIAEEIIDDYEALKG